MIDATQDTEKQLLLEVRAAKESGGAVDAILKTDERVFARITDGIYREPASALRELIANAYDADATEVRIETDAPRFSRITIRDNGHGLTEEALVHVICHIGGSLKRTLKGKEYQVVDATDPYLSPKKRKLIGKLGIGLFSVSQLTHHLTIVTKVEGENVRRICDILLMPQSDVVPAKDEKFITGKVKITTMPAEDLTSHGTEITLLEIRSFVRESLQSAALWASIESEPAVEMEETEGEAQPVEELPLTANDELTDDDFVDRPLPPVFHIGRVSKAKPDFLALSPNVPWEVDDSPLEKFQKLVTKVSELDKGDSKSEKIKLNDVLDTYFRTIWTLSLSVPIPYVKQHPFCLNSSSGVLSFSLSNKPVKPTAEPLQLSEGQDIRSKCGFVTAEKDSELPFSVIFDGIELRRPLEFPKIMLESDPKPLIFVGRIKSEMTSIPSEYSGGPIEIEGYFYWQQRIVPAEHNGIMVRINGASGILFDDHFLKYQISEQTRLRQLTAEIYVIKGLDAALNIDRESFNVAHPHYQFLKKWVHHSLRQVMSRHKSLAKTSKDSVMVSGFTEAKSKISEILAEGTGKNLTTEDIVFSKASQMALRESAIVFDRDVVFSPRVNIRPNSKSDKLKEELLEEQIKAVAAVLEGYGLLKGLTPQQRDALLQKIVAIFTVGI